MVDFRKLMFDKMTEEERESFLFWEKSYQRDVKKFQEKTDEHLVIFFLYYWMNSQFHHDFTDRNHDHCGSTYDSVLIKVLIPELITRFMKLTGQEVKPKNEPFRRLWEICTTDVEKFMKSR